ncbi:hypothetical protein E6W39_10665 [Kitasatospora acidiphila]|uniref:Uncharacterized protein n=1 Tax=Kitasatospora acidiphila TaxID=2567942 RepID=A0A540W0V6_9ACTN|nr:hypothetical protein [Kitasatospora acidiphila]TQF02638.1 hypothetical protein E6W39_10665 [Kitasatospora acidiphila]
MSAARPRPIAPDGPGMRDYTEARVTELIRELQEHGRPLGLLWGSARTSGTVDGHVLVNFGNAPVSTLLNLLNLVQEAERSGSWES